MNKAYRSIYNEKLGTFVAVAENVKARGKKSSSTRKGVLAAAVASALALSVGGVLADVEISDPGNEINFTAPGGAINFGSGGSITGLASLTVNGALTADQLTVGGEQVVTIGQLNGTNDLIVNNTNKIEDHETRITANRTEIDDHETRITANRTEIDDHETRITTINGTLENLGVDATKPGSGIKYFRANSTKDDAEALGEDSVAIGPEAKSEGKGSFAAGLGANAIKDKSLAVGIGAEANGSSAIALGDGAKVLSALDEDSEAAIAIGKDSESSGKASVAMGEQAKASGSHTIAFGSEANASGANSIAFGSKAVAGESDSVAIGNGAQALAREGISIGLGAGVQANPSIAGDQVQNIAIGTKAGTNVTGQVNAALGYEAGQNVEGNHNVAFGTHAGKEIKGDNNVSIGRNANVGVTANQTVSIGEDTKADTEGVAIGFNASAGGKGVSLGRQTQAVGTGTAVGPSAYAESGHVALGLNSRATQLDTLGKGFLTDSDYSGNGVVSVGSSKSGNVFQRRIVNVEDGANPTDAVNVRQLTNAIGNIDISDINFADGVIEGLQTQINQNMQHYVSINDGGDEKGNKGNNGADGVDSIAIGPEATTKNKDSIAIGHLAGAEGDSAVVMGHDIKGYGKNSTTIGNSESRVRSESGIAIGTTVVSRGENSIVIGRDSYSDLQGEDGKEVKNAIVIGTESKATAYEGIVLGYQSLVNAPKGIAQGHQAHALAENAMAFGTNSAASGVNSQASGTRAAASGTSSQASGTDAKAYAERSIALGDGAESGKSSPVGNDEKDNNIDSIAIGTGAIAQRNSSLATGTRAEASADYSQASGYEAEATGVNSIAQGTGAEASGKDAIAQGTSARALFTDSMAFGRDAVSSAEKALAFGAEATAQNTNSVAIGAGAKAENNGSVALGSDAVTADVEKTKSADLNGIKYGYDFAGSGDGVESTVSVGSAGKERTITNVAAGRISSTSTDAINGSQLFATNTVLGNVANTTKNILGTSENTEEGQGNATLNSDGTLTMTNIGGTDKNTVHDAIKYAAQGWNVSANGDASENVAPGGSVDFSSDDNISIVRDDGSTDLKFALNKDLTVGEGNEPGSIVVNGKDGKDGVTINGEDGSIGLAGTDGENGLTLRGDQGVAGVAGIDGVTRIIYEDANGDRHEVATMEDGLKFAGNENPTDGYITRKLNEEIRVFGGAQKQTDGVYSSDNVKTVATQDGGIEIQFAETPNFQGADMGGKQITNVGSGRTDTEGNAVDKIADANPDNAATIGDIQTITNVESGGGFGLTDANGESVKKNLGETIKVFDPNENIVTAADNVKGELHLSLSNDLTIGNGNEPGSIVVNGKDGKDGVTINGEDGSIGLAGTDGENGLTLRGDQGVAGVAGIDGVTRIIYEDANGDRHEVATMEDGLKFAGNENPTDGYITRKLNEEIRVFGGAQKQTDGVYSSDNVKTVATQDGGIEIQFADTPNFQGADMGNKKITSVESGLGDKDLADIEGDDLKNAVNVGDLQKVNAVASAGWDLSTHGNKEDLEKISENIRPGDEVNFVNEDDNVALGQKALLNEDDEVIGQQVIMDLAKTITVGGDGTTENPGVIIGDNGAGEGVPGITVPSGVDGSQNVVIGGGDVTISGLTGATGPIKVGETLMKGLSFSGNEGDLINRQLGQELKIIGDGQWLVTETVNGDTIRISLAEGFPVVPNPNKPTPPVDPGTPPVEPDPGTPTTPPVKPGQDVGNIIAGGDVIAGPNITVSEDGYDLVIGTTPDVNHNSVTVGKVVINQGGINAGGNTITNLAPGVNGTDAVNKDQLDKVEQTAEMGWNVSTQGGTATQVKPGDTVDFANKDGNIVVANNGTNVTVDLAKDIAVDNVQVDNSVKVGGNTNNQTIIKEGSVTTNEVIIKRPGNPDGDMNVGETLNKGITFVGTEGQSERKLGDTLEIVGANDNITTKVNGPKGILEIALSNDLALDSVTINNGGPIINDNGINMVDKRITNVADGIDAGDAVNVGQLGRVQDNLQGQVNHLRHDVRRLDKKLSAGVAAAMATAGLPQAYLPGKSMMAMSGGVWNGESGMAIGFSTITDNGKWVIKAAGNATGRGDYGGTVGVGYQW